MVYKYKNNKWSRMIAARKQAAADAAAAAAVEQTNTDSPGAAVAAAEVPEGVVGGAEVSCTTPTISAPKRDDGAAAAASVPASAAMATSTDAAADAAAAIASINSLCAVTPQEYAEDVRTVVQRPLPSLSAVLPRVLDAFPVVTDPKASPHFTGYVVQYAEGCRGGGVAGVTTIYGVCCDGGAGHSCLQVVHWEAEESSPAPRTDTATHKVIVYVDAERRCFALSPSSVVSLEKKSLDDTATAEPHAPAAPTAYWLIPTVLREHFLALLQALHRCRTTTRLPESLPTHRVVLHSTWWLAHDQAASIIATTAAATTAPKTRQKKSRKRARPTRGPAVPAAVVMSTVAPPADTAACCIPYVVAVEGDDGSGAAMVFVLGNRLSPFPPDYVL